MKPVKLAFALVFLAFSVPALLSARAAEEKKAQLYFVEDYAVKPSMAPQFEASIKEFIMTVLKPYGWSWSFETYSTEDFHYYFLYRIEDLAELDKAYDDFRGIIGKYGEREWAVLYRKIGNAIEYCKQGTITLMPELSYFPAVPRLKPDEKKLVSWGYCYVMPGRDIEFEGLVRKIVMLYKARNIGQGLKTWMGGLGAESPMYFFTETAKSESDLFLTGEGINRLLEPDLGRLWKEMLGTIRRLETKMGCARPDLSFLPLTVTEEK